MIRTKLWLAAALVAVSLTTVLAQEPPGPQQMQQAVEQRIQALQAKLAITPGEMRDWNDFAQVMRDNASSTDQLFQQRAQSAATMTAVENMRSYAGIARSYADNTQKLADAFATFYGKLTPEQQKSADALFRAPPPTSPAPHH